MVKIITTDTVHPFSFPEGRQTFISKPLQLMNTPRAHFALVLSFPSKYMQICRWRFVLMPLRFHQIKIIIQPEATVYLHTRVTE